MVRRISAWSTNLTTRAVATPKLMVVDSGLAGHLVGMTLKRAKHPTAPVSPIMENFVLGELARQLSWADEPVRLYHYRDRDKNEVDAILERASGEVVAMEVKATETVRGEDFRGIQHLMRRIGDRLLAGIVLYAGRQALPFGRRLCALPLSALWITDSGHPGPRATRTGHGNSVNSVAFSPDGHTLATASKDNTARLWNVSDPGHPDASITLTSHTDSVNSVIFSPDGNTLATGSNDATARLWSTDIDRIAQQICAITYPSITHAEWSRYFPDLAYQNPCRR